MRHLSILLCALILLRTRVQNRVTPQKRDFLFNKHFFFGQMIHTHFFHFVLTCIDVGDTYTCYYLTRKNTFLAIMFSVKFFKKIFMDFI